MELGKPTSDAVEGQGQAQDQNNSPRSNNGLRRAHTVAQTGGSQAQRGSQHRAAGRLRASSLRRANQQHRNNQNKSNDLGRQQESSQEASGTTGSPTAETTGGSRSDAREGRYFTVGNVGHNGKMYLRSVPCCYIHTANPRCPSKSIFCSLNWMMADMRNEEIVGRRLIGHRELETRLEEGLVNPNRLTYPQKPQRRWSVVGDIACGRARSLLMCGPPRSERIAARAECRCIGNPLPQRSMTRDVIRIPTSMVGSLP